MAATPRPPTPPDEPVVAVPRRLVSAAYNALRSYEFGNAATDLAATVASQLESYCNNAPASCVVAVTPDDSDGGHCD